MTFLSTSLLLAARSWKWSGTSRWRGVRRTALVRKERRDETFCVPSSSSTRPPALISPPPRLSLSLSPTHSARDVLLINGKFLGRGTAIVLHRGDVLDITLLNSLPADFPDIERGLTLHFHGLAMPGGAAWYDGVPYLHQCPIRPVGGRMTYRFRIDDGPGTFWVHAHTMQIMDGLFAPLVILPPRSAAAGAVDPALVGVNRVPTLDIPLMVGDWYHTSATGLQVGLARPFDPAKVVKGDARPDGGHQGHGGAGANATGAFTWVAQPQAVLFNGRGFFGDCALGGAGNTSEPACGPPALTIPPGRSSALNPAASASNPGCTHEVVAVPVGGTTRLRLIGTGSLAYLSICVEGHSLTVIAADGVPVQPLNVTCVDLNLGQRMDVLLTADKGTAGDVFWISALPQFRPGSPAGFAVLQYTNATDAPAARLPATRPPQPGSVPAWSAADQARIRAPAWALSASSSSPSPRDATHLPPGQADLRPPAMTGPPVRLDITQPLLEQTGQIRWALNNVATGGTPGCGAYLADVVGRGGMGAVTDDAAATAAAGGAAADDDLLGKQLVTDRTRAPTFLAGGDGSPPPLTTPAVGRLVIPVPKAGSVVDVILDNLPANANGGDYRGNGAAANRTTSEMHPLHWHGFHGWLLGTGAQGAGPFREDADRAGLNTADPPLRDSVTVLPNAWVVVRLPLASPGAWILHCHMHSHAEMGMQAVFAVELGALPARREDDFPACARECPSAAAPWKPATVREEWGGTTYDTGPDSLPPPAEGGEVAVGLNASSVPA